MKSSGTGKEARPQMMFASDNWAGAAPEIVEAVAREAASYGPAYGTSSTDRAATARFSDLFEREVAVFFVATGSAANTLALASVNRPGGIVLCHSGSHIIEDECGGVEYLTGGARLQPVEGAAGMLDRDALAAALNRLAPGNVHAGQPMAISITQLTEAGTAYPLEAIRTIADVAKSRGLPLHMDGARFANALVHLNCTPAEMTWKAGVDVLSFGGTKNGCIGAEALVVFDPERAQDLPYLRKRAGQLFSKARFIAAQFEAYLSDDLWLKLARRANGMADRLRDGLGSGSARLAWPTAGNEVFAVLPAGEAERLRAAGAVFHTWHAPRELALGRDETVVRLVTSFATQEAEVEDFLGLLRG